MNGESDSDLIRRSFETPVVFGELFVRHSQAIHHYALRRVGHGSADDVLSDTFLIAFQQRAKFDLERPDARPWLFGIATNLIKRHHHGEARALRALHEVPLGPFPAAEDSTIGVQSRIVV